MPKEFTDFHLRPVRESDAPAILAAFKDPEMSRQGDVVDHATATAYAARLAANPTAFAIATETELVGVVALSADPENKLGWCWYWIAAPYRGQGITSVSARTLANWALTAGGFYRLELGHRANNPASGKVAVAAGFVQEGLEREKFLIAGTRYDVLTYGRLATDPVPTGPVLELQPHPDFVAL